MIIIRINTVNEFCIRTTAPRTSRTAKDALRSAQSLKTGGIKVTAQIIIGLTTLAVIVIVMAFTVILQFKFSEQNARRLEHMQTATEHRLDVMRDTMEGRLSSIQSDNAQKLDEMRSVVDEKLQRTINQRMNESFKLVNDRLEQVYKGLGEMQNLAAGVGDLKKVLSNVKTRGILGEVQLAAILQEILSPEQYDTNVATKRGSRAVVEFAVKIPSEEGTIYLPVDSKFPGDTYGHLRDAYDSGDAFALNEAAKLLITTIKSEAKDIRDKYIDPPNTTEFGIMFLPFEGLYAEVINRGMIEVLQRDYNVIIAGPSTMAALLNSLQMGFRTFAIQQRSGEVWRVLSSVKTEFDKFEGALKMTQKRMNQVNEELDKLVGVRTRSIQRSLKDISSLDDMNAVGDKKSYSRFDAEDEI